MKPKWIESGRAKQNWKAFGIIFKETDRTNRTEKNPKETELNWMESNRNRRKQIECTEQNETETYRVNQKKKRNNKKKFILSN